MTQQIEDASVFSFVISFFFGLLYTSSTCIRYCDVHQSSVRERWEDSIRLIHSFVPRKKKGRHCAYKKSQVIPSSPKINQSIY